MKKEETYYNPFPEEYEREKLNELYQKIPLKDTTSRLLRKYFNAAANLYGIITLRDLYDIIISQNKDLVTEEEFLAFADIARHEREGYYILGKSELYCDGPTTELMEYEVIDVVLLGKDLELYLKTLLGHQGSLTMFQIKRSSLPIMILFIVKEPQRRLLLETSSLP